MTGTHPIASASWPDTAHLVLPRFGSGFSCPLIRGFALAKVEPIETTEGFKYGNNAHVGATRLDWTVGVVVLALARWRA